MGRNRNSVATLWLLSFTTHTDRKGDQGPNQTKRPFRPTHHCIPLARMHAPGFKAVCRWSVWTQRTMLFDHCWINSRHAVLISEMTRRAVLFSRCLMFGLNVGHLHLPKAERFGLFQGFHRFCFGRRLRGLPDATGMFAQQDKRKKRAPGQIQNVAL